MLGWEAGQISQAKAGDPRATRDAVGKVNGAVLNPGPSEQHGTLA